MYTIPPQIATPAAKFCGRLRDLVQTASAPRIDAQELSWAAEACETADLRLIAYLSCFRDDVTARAQPSLAVCDAEGALFVDYDYSAWLNPYE